MRRLALCTLLFLATSASAQSRADTTAYSAAECPPCAGWNRPASPERLFGNTWYVGTRGLAALLITSPDGHVLIDGGLPESAPLVMASIRAAGFRVEDVRLIINSHVHYDHAGGIAALQRVSGAVVAASPAAASVLRTGLAARNDPQHDTALAFPAVRNVRVFQDGDTLKVGALRLRAFLTEGHSPGGTSWSWESCDGARCLTFVYADSQTPVSDNAFRFTGTAAVAAFERGFSELERIECDVLIAPHPGAVRLWQRLAGTEPLVDRGACRRYAENARQALRARLERERQDIRR